MYRADGVFSIDRDIAPPSPLARVCRHHRAWLVLDDAHGLGVLGDRGRGSLSQHNVSATEVPVLATVSARRL